MESPTTDFPLEERFPPQRKELFKSMNVFAGYVSLP
jgi:hypothetical protein